MTPTFSASLDNGRDVLQGWYLEMLEAALASPVDQAVAQMDAALNRMRTRGHDDSPHFRRLLAKREAVAGGAPFALHDASPEAIRSAGRMIGALTKATGLRRPAGHAQS